MNTPTTLVATLGGAYSYSHLATIQWAEKQKRTTGITYKVVLVQSIGEAFALLVERKVNYAILPNENSTVSRVADFTRCLSQVGSLGPYAVDQLWLQIRICLMAHKSLKQIGNIECVLGRPEALAQCATSLRNLGLTKTTGASSNASAAELVAIHPEFKSAAIGPEELARHHDLEILAHNIQDDREGNHTQFTVFGYTRSVQTGDDETLMLFSLPNTKGALAKVLCVFWLMGSNVSSIHSITKGKNTGGFIYEFQIQFAGHEKDRRVRLALWLLRRFFAKNVRVIGSFPASR